jgi:hypothetical protein
VGRIVSAVSVALLVATIGVFLLMPAMSNGGLLSGFEFFGLVALGLLCVASYYLVARAPASSRIVLGAQAVVVGMSAPFLVLVAPLAFCIVFRPGASCV